MLAAWSRFVVGLLYRHPDATPQLMAAVDAIWVGAGEVFKDLYEREKIPGDPDTLAEWVALRDPLSAGKLRINAVITLLDSHPVREHIATMKWAVLDISASPHRLLLSDRPVDFLEIAGTQYLLSGKLRGHSTYCPHSPHPKALPDVFCPAGGELPASRGRMTLRSSRCDGA